MPQFDSILAPDLRIDQSLIDYDKLKIQGVFPRKQHLPGDVFPTLSTMQAIGDDGNASVLKATKAGSLHVTVDASAGGSGGPYQQQHSSNAGLGGYNQFEMKIFGSGSGDFGPIGPINILYAAQFAAVFTSAGGVEGGISTIQLYPLPDQLVGFDLFSIPTSAPNAVYPNGTPNFQQYVQFGPGIDMNKTFPNNQGFELWWYGFNALHGTGALTLYYS